MSQAFGIGDVVVRVLHKGVLALAFVAALVVFPWTVLASPDNNPLVLQGEIQVVIAERFDNFESQKITYLKLADGSQVQLLLDEPTSSPVISGDLVEVFGFPVEGRAPPYAVKVSSIVKTGERTL